MCVYVCVCNIVAVYRSALTSLEVDLAEVPVSPSVPPSFHFSSVFLPSAVFSDRSSWN